MSETNHVEGSHGTAKLKVNILYRYLEPEFTTKSVLKWITDIIPGKWKIENTEDLEGTTRLLKFVQDDKESDPIELKENCYLVIVPTDLQLGMSTRIVVIEAQTFLENSTDDVKVLGTVGDLAKSLAPKPESSSESEESEESEESVESIENDEMVMDKLQ